MGQRTPLGSHQGEMAGEGQTTGAAWEEREGGGVAGRVVERVKGEG